MLGEHRSPFLAEQDAKLSRDIRELRALVEGAQRLLRRVETDGAKLLSWFPSVLRHLLHSRIVGPLPTASGKSYFGKKEMEDQCRSNTQQDAVLRVLVMLEILDRGAEGLDEAEAQSKNALSETVRKRMLQDEFIRILVSSEDLLDTLERELEDVRTDCEELQASGHSPLSPSEVSVIHDPARASYAHPLLDRDVLPTDARHSARPDLTWMQSTVAPSVLARSRQRAHSFPLALGSLARSVIMGTITPSRMRTRAKTLDDSMPLSSRRIELRS